MGKKEVEAGGAYVRVFVKNEELDKGLTASNQKIRAGLSMAKTAIASTGSGVGAAAIAGYSAIATLGRGVANAVAATATKAANANRETQCRSLPMRPCFAPRPADRSTVARSAP